MKSNFSCIKYKLIFPTLQSFKLVWLTLAPTHNIQIKHLHGTYIYEKQQIKLFLSKNFLIDKLNEKISSKMPSQLGLIHLICCPYCYKGSYKIFIFIFSGLPEP